VNSNLVIRFSPVSFGEQRNRSILWLLIPIAFGLRLVVDAGRQWCRTRRFTGCSRGIWRRIPRSSTDGRVHHPAGTWLMGFNELGVRALGSALAFGAVLVLLSMCRRTRAGERGAMLLGVMWVCSPMFAGIATLIHAGHADDFLFDVRVGGGGADC